MRPARSSLEYFERALENHTRVANVDRVTHQVYLIQRHTQSDVKLFLTDSYVLGLAEYYDIRGEIPDVDAIVTIGAYNSVSGDAWHQGQRDGVGVFQFKEFYGALNYEGRDFLAYVPPDPRGRS